MERKRKMLSVGINYLGTSAELKGCVNDSENLLALIQERYPDKKIEIKQLINEEATKDNILAAFEWLLDEMESGDKMVFHYSGHGSWVTDVSGDESDGRDECIVPNDFEKSGMIIDDVIREKLINQVPKHALLHILMDCCHSKTMGDLKYSYKFKNGFNTVRAEYRLRTTPGHIIMISGCADNDYSADAYEHDVIDGGMEPQGAMTCAFVRAYRKKRPTYTKLITTMREMLRQGGYTQIVQLTSGKRLCLRDRFELF